MASEDFELAKYKDRMSAAHDSLKHDFSGLRTGRASATFLDPIVVDVYGSKMPIGQVGTVSVPEPRMISVQVWDKTNVSAVERAIRESNLGLNPIVDGTTLRLPLPQLTADRRQELVKVAHKYAESTRVAMRNVRRDGMDLLKKLEKDGDIGKDEMHTQSTKVQELTDKMIKDVDDLLAAKETEITTV